MSNNIEIFSTLKKKNTNPLTNNKPSILSTHNSNTKSGNNYTTRLNRGEHHFRIIHELLRAKLRELAPEFYRHYRQKLLDKVIKEGKKMTKPASPGKNKTQKSKNAIPKYGKALRLIKDDYIQGKSVDELYDWWAGKMKTYGMASEGWHFTWPEICIPLYNQVTHLSNSYNLYPPLEGDDLSREENRLLDLYFYQLEEIYLKSIIDDEPNYLLLLESHITYTELYELRMTRDITKKCEYTEYFRKMISKTKDKPIILLPVSTQISQSEFIKFYATPIVQFINVFAIAHDTRHTPCMHIFHDIEIHNDDYLNSLILQMNTYISINDVLIEFSKLQKIIKEIYTNKDKIQFKYMHNINTITLDDVFFKFTHEKYLDVVNWKIQKKTINILWYKKFIIHYNSIDWDEVNTNLQSDQFFYYDNLDDIKTQYYQFLKLMYPIIIKYYPELEHKID